MEIIECLEIATVPAFVMMEPQCQGSCLTGTKFAVNNDPVLQPFNRPARCGVQ